MDYLKYVRNGEIHVSTDVDHPIYFDTHGLMARFKIVSGSISISSPKPPQGFPNSEYPIKEGETFDFVGKIRYCGGAQIRYMLFDKV